MGDYRTLDAILAEIKGLIEDKASGTYFINDHEHAGWLRLREGHLEQLACENHFNDDAVPLLTRIVRAIGRFVPGPVFPSRQPPPGEAVQRWLSGDHVVARAAPPVVSAPSPEPAPAPPPAAVRSSPSAATEHRDGRHKAIERIALTYFGPIASVLCDEAWTAHADIESALAQIATNLVDEAEARRFLADARKAIAGMA